MSVMLGIRRHREVPIYNGYDRISITLAEITLFKLMHFVHWTGYLQNPGHSIISRRRVFGNNGPEIVGERAPFYG